MPPILKKRVKVIPDWKRVALKAWSMWAIYISIVLQFSELLFPAVIQLAGFTHQAFDVVSAIIMVAAGAVRILSQENLSGR